MANTTWNPSDKTANVTLTGGNLIATSTTFSLQGVRAVDRQAFGKFYWEYTCNVNTTSGTAVGIASPTLVLSNATTAAQSGICALLHTGNVYADGVNTLGGFGTITNGTVVCIAVDLTARLVWFRIGAAGNWNTVAANNPATGVGGILVAGLGNGIPAYPAAWFANTSEQTTANFGDTAFTGAVPGGYTSGFTSGASVPTNAVASQALAEHWLTTDPEARITQVVAEQWATVAEGAPVEPNTESVRVMVMA